MMISKAIIRNLKEGFGLCLLICRSGYIVNAIIQNMHYYTLGLNE